MIKGYEYMNNETIENFLHGQGKLVEVLKDVREIVESKNDGELLEVLSACQFFTVSIYDLLISVKCIQITQSKVEKNFHARVLAVICYQLLIESTSITGAGFRKAIDNLSQHDLEVMKNLDNANKLLARFRNKHSSFLNEIRVNALAHRNKDLKRQIEFIEQLDVEKVFRISLELFEIIDFYSRGISEFLKISMKNIQLRLAE